MKLVVTVFEKHAKRYINDIVSEIDKYGNKIDKVRAGYLLEEICKLENATVNDWQQNAQRGGSQKLDPTKPYKSKYSVKWCLSINQ